MQDEDRPFKQTALGQNYFTAQRMWESYLNINIKQYLEVGKCSTFASRYDTLSSHKPADDHDDTQCGRVIFKHPYSRKGKYSLRREYYWRLRKSNN
jgi:hypothetical protein